MEFLKSYDSATGKYFDGANYTHFDTEFQAFSAGSMVKPYSLFTPGPKGYQLLTDYLYRAYPNADQLQFSPINVSTGASIMRLTVAIGIFTCGVFRRSSFLRC